MSNTGVAQTSVCVCYDLTQSRTDKTQIHRLKSVLLSNPFHVVDATALLNSSNSNTLWLLIAATPRKPRNGAHHTSSVMNDERSRQRTLQYRSEAWRDDETGLSTESYLLFQLNQFNTAAPDAREQTRLFSLLGLINYRILKGNRVYIQVGGTVYKTLYGCYWRSVFTGVEHYLLRCQEISGGMWAEGNSALGMIDLPISHTKDGWTAQGHSLMFMLNRDF